MKHLASIGELFLFAIIIALVLNWLAGHFEEPPWIQTWAGRLSVVGFIWAVACSLAPAAEWLQEYRGVAEQRRAELRERVQRAAENRRPVREQLRQYALAYEQKFGWTVDLPPAERRLRALQNFDHVMAWPDEDHELRAVLANDDFDVVAREHQGLVDRLLQILDARAELRRIALLNLDAPARAAHQLREQRAIQQARVQEAHEARAFQAETERILAEGRDAAFMEDGACCPMATLLEKKR